jgi:isocitrate dehydrogenase
MSREKKSIVVAEGDGIGPEIMEATLRILAAAGANLDIHKIEIGEKVYLGGHPTGIEESTWETIRKCGVFLKAPITTPQGGGFKSLNVTIRTAFGLYANVRPCVSYAPFVETKHPQMDVVIVRENEEDLYTGIEYRQSAEVYQALKIITRPGCERIIRYAFEYARHNNRKKVTCFTKDNILKLSDGLFHKVFDEIAAEYPDIQNEHWIIDIGAAKLADTPEAFDVVVMANLYGDILSDVAAQIAGSVGLAGSANIGQHCAMFEAIHGSAPRRAGQNMANPSGLILASIMMLVHLEEPAIATTIHNAWLKTLEDGIHTYDIFNEGISREKVGTKEFTDAVIERLGKKPAQLKAVDYQAGAKRQKAGPHKNATQPESKQELVGVDLFIHSKGSVEEVHKSLSKIDMGPFTLAMIANRGVKVWPEKQPETLCVDVWRCRFLRKETSKALSQKEIVALLNSVTAANIQLTQTEHLFSYDGVAGF